MKVLNLILILALCMPLVASGKEIKRLEDNARRISLFDDKCTNQIIIEIAKASEISPETIAQLKKAEVKFRGRLIHVCYVEIVADQIMGYVDQDGNVGAMEMEGFKPLDEIKKKKGTSL